MELLSVDIRGAIGFYKGLNLDEVNIDFTKFNPGLIALIGPNGVGKTTFIENLHPYNSLVSRDGKLQDHFRLKNSYRILKVRMNGKIYECKLLIDGMTGAAEAYITEDGIPLNDGKITTYKEHITKIFGTPELFFNSIFSAQKATGIASLKTNDRRELFYEILNLLQYVGYNKSAGKRKSAEEQKLAKLEGELKVLLEEVNSITYTKPMIAEKIYQKEEKTKLIDVANKELEKLRENFEQVKREVIKLETLKDQQAEIKKELDATKQLIENHNLNIQESKDALKKEKEEKIKSFEADNNYDAEIKQLESDKKVSEEKHQIESTQLNTNIENIRKEVLDIEAEIELQKVKITRAEKIEGNKTTIETTLARKKEISTKLSELMLSDKTLSDEVNILKVEKENQLKSVLSLENENTLKLKSIKQLKDLNEKDEKRTEELKQEKLDKIAEIEKETLILKDVPCDETLGATCPLISNTIDKKKKLDLTLNNFDEKIENLLETTNKRLADSIEYENAVAENKKKIASETERIEITFTPKVKNIEGQLEKIGEEIKTLTAELAKINEHKWEDLETELKEATETKKIAQSVIENKKQMIVEKEKSKTLLEDNVNTIANNLADKLSSLNSQIDSKRKLFAAERDNIVKQYDEKIKNVDAGSVSQLTDLEKKQEELSKKYDPEMESAYNKKVEEQNKIAEEEKEALVTIETLKTDKINIEAEIKTMEEALIKKKLNEDKIAEKEAGKALVNREITEYGLLEKAFDKTGIPVLKLENSGYEITNIANELLSIFDNKFRVIFETLQMKADKKGMKEVFNINVMDEEGLCELGNKSGGEAIWIEIALQLAIGLMVRKQGKNILTGFLDEQDGPLDIDNAYHFLEMIKKVHKMAGTHHTLLITHRPELQSLIPQQIVFNKDRGIELITEEI